MGLISGVEETADASVEVGITDDISSAKEVKYHYILEYKPELL